jgi:hypothetical protein
MKRDIRGLFNNEDELEAKQLPGNHRAEFLKKLHKPHKPMQKTLGMLRLIAVLFIACFVIFNVLEMDAKKPEPSTLIIAQIETIETEYLKDIETEWQNFVAIAEDEILVERFRKKLKELDTDYQDISKQFKSDANNILVIEALVDNLQTRLRILKDIQAHIKILNQKNEHNEDAI